MVEPTSANRWAIGALLLQAIVLGMGLYAIGQLSAESVPDTPTYVDFPLFEPVAAAAHIRTYGYPLFLKLDATDDHRLTPLLHLLVHAAAAIAVFLSLRTWRYPCSAATLISSGILWSLTLMRYGRMLTPDCLAHSLGVIAIAMLLGLLRHPNQWKCWFGVGFVVFAAYQCRPAYVFLVPLVPCLGCVLKWWHAPEYRPELRDLFGFGARLAALTLIPLLLFASYRYFMVGHFGLVAFGGYNASGIVCQFLEEEDIPQLPAEVHELARRGLQRRERVYAEHGWSTEMTTSYFDIEQRFDASTWGIFVPVAKEMWPDDPIEVNRRLSTMARSTARLHPKEYVVWLFKAAVRGCYLLAAEWILNVFVALMLPLLVLLFLINAKCSGATGSASAESKGGATGSASAESRAGANSLELVAVPLIIALSVALTKMSLVIITTPPLGRFMDPAAVWMPAVLAAMVCQQYGRLREKSARVC